MIFSKHGIVLLFGAMVALAPTWAGAAPPRPEVTIGAQEVQAVQAWLRNAVVGMSIAAQNRKYADIQADRIDALDKQWRQERKAEDQPLIAATLNNPLSTYLTQIQAGSGGLYTEIFVMDAKGLNVGQSSITSDFWQGDEAKYQNTFPKGDAVVFIDDAELEKETQTWRAQLSMTISDDAHVPIGAVTIEFNLTELARRKGAF